MKVTDSSCSSLHSKMLAGTLLKCWVFDWRRNVTMTMRGPATSVAASSAESSRGMMLHAERCSRLSPTSLTTPWWTDPIFRVYAAMQPTCVIFQSQACNLGHVFHSVYLPCFNFSLSRPRQACYRNSLRRPRRWKAPIGSVDWLSPSNCCCFGEKVAGSTAIRAILTALIRRSGRWADTSWLSSS